jgi:hypothetical protein
MKNAASEPNKDDRHQRTGIINQREAPKEARHYTGAKVLSAAAPNRSRQRMTDPTKGRPNNMGGASR